MTIFDLLYQFDAPIERALQHLHGLSPPVDALLVTVVDMNLIKGLPFCAFLWALWLNPPAGPSTGRPPEVRQFVLRAIAGAMLAIVVGRLAQTLFPARLRPMHDVIHGFTFPLDARPDDVLAGFSSFPSDHAVVIAGFVTAIWYRSRWLGAVSAVWAALVILFPRIYLGYHYPSDVVIGAVIGVAVMMAVLRVPLPERLLERPTAYVERHAALFYGLAFLGLEQLGTNFDDLRALAGTALRIIRHDF